MDSFVYCRVIIDGEKPEKPCFTHFITSFCGPIVEKNNQKTST